MNVDNVRSQMRKGMLEYCILLLLHREASYASDIILKLNLRATLQPLHPLKTCRHFAEKDPQCL